MNKFKMPSPWVVVIAVVSLLVISTCQTFPILSSLLTRDRLVGYGSYVFVLSVIALVSWKLRHRVRPIVCILMLGLSWLTMMGLIGPLIYVVLFLVAALCIGDLCRRSLGYCYKRDIRADGSSLIMVGLWVLGIITWVANHFPVNNRSFFAAILILPVLISWRKLFSIGVRKRNEIMSRGSLQSDAAELTVSIISVAFLPYVAIGYYGGDELIKHLAIAKEIQGRGFYPFDPNFALSLDLAIVPQSAYTVVYILSGEDADRLLNLIYLLMSIRIIYRTARHFSGSAIAATSTALVVCAPILVWTVSAVYTDNCLLFAGAVIAYWLVQYSKRARPGFLAWGIFMLSLLLFYKQQSLFIFIPIVVISFLMSAYAITFSKAACAIAMGALVPGVVMSAVLFHNYLKSGNPVFPFFNKIFCSPYFPAINFEDGRWRNFSILTLPWDLTFHGDRFSESFSLTIGICCFVLSPIILYGVLRRRSAKLSSPLAGYLPIMLFLVFCAGMFLWMQVTGPYLRYGIVFIPLVAIFIALGLNAIRTSNGLCFKILLFVVLPVVFLIDSYSAYNFSLFGGSGGFSFGQSPNLPQLPWANRETHWWDAPRSALALANSGSDGKRVLISGTQLVYLSDSGETLSDRWYFPKFDAMAKLSKSDPGRVMQQLFIEDKITSIVAQDTVSDSLASNIPRGWLENLGKFGDYSVYIPSWSEWHEDIMGTDSLQVSEPMPRVIEFTPKPNEEYIIELMASSLDQDEARGRFQVIWVDANGKRAGLLLDVFTVNRQGLLMASRPFRAPPGACVGRWYISSHDVRPINVAKYTLKSRHLKFLDGM